MALIGTAIISIDAKNRAVMPASFRAKLPRELLITLDMDQKALLIFTGQSWNSFIEKAETDFDEKARRCFYAFSHEFCIDNNGRFLLPKKLTEYIPFDKQCEIKGLDDRLGLYPIKSKKDHLACNSFTSS